MSWIPSTSTIVNASFHLARDDSEAQPQKAFGTLSTATPPGLDFLDEQTIFGNLGASDISFDQAVPYVTSQNQMMSTTNWSDVRTGGSRIGKVDVTGGYVKVDHDFGKAKLTSITSYDVTKGKYEEDNGVSGLTSGPNHDGLNQEALLINFDTTYKQFSQELRLASVGAVVALPLGDRALLLQRELDPGPEHPLRGQRRAAVPLPERERPGLREHHGLQHRRAEGPELRRATARRTAASPTT